MSVFIARCAAVDQPGWLELRQALWPNCSREEHLAEMASFCKNPRRYAQFVAYSQFPQAVGFVEVSLRPDYVNGTESSPVAFLEGIFVAPEDRQKGVGRTLAQEAEQWGKSLGCQEFASDALFENEPSHAVHRALGFQETERVVFFRKTLT